MTRCQPRSPLRVAIFLCSPHQGPALSGTGRAAERRGRLAGGAADSGIDTREETAYFLNRSVKTDTPLTLAGFRAPEHARLGRSGQSAPRCSSGGETRVTDVLVVISTRSLIHATGEESPIDGQDVAGHEGRGLGGEKDGGSDQLLQSPITRHRSTYQQLLTAA